MSQIVGYDFTLKSEGNSVENVTAFLKEWCKQWVYQLEEGERGYRHYQGRVRLIKKQYVGVLQKKWQEAMPGIHVSPTHGESFSKSDFMYVMKADTRVDGPWKDSDEEKHMTRQLREFMAKKMYPWQETLIELAKEWDDRYVNLIVDECGGAGKSRLVEYMQYHDIGHGIPPFDSLEDIMHCVHGQKPRKAYIIDMPRAMPKKRMQGFFSGMEYLKNGQSYDKRYKFTSRTFDCPQIFIFTNETFDFRMLSPDRWIVYDIDENWKLVRRELVLPDRPTRKEWKPY